jgi:hypothetical protein
MDFLFDHINGIAARARPGTPWREKVMELCQPEKRRGLTEGDAGLMLMEAARMLRAARELSTEAYCYLVAWIVESEVELTIREFYRREYEPRFKAIQDAYRLRANWEFREGEEPPEYVALSGEFDRRVAEITAEGFRRHGEPILAENYERDRRGFARLRDVGRASLLVKIPVLVSVG